MGADGILASGQVQRFLPAVDGPLLQIEVQPAAADAAAGRPGLPPQVSGHPGPQLRDAEGLGQVVVPAQPQAGEHVGLLGLGGEKKNGAGGQGADAAAGGKAVLPRHHHVQENAVRPAAVGLAHRPAAVEEGDLVSVPLQGGFQQGAEIPVVVHHQNMGHGYHLSSAEDRAPTTGRRGCKYGRDRRRRTAACGLRPAAHYSTA